MLQHSESPVPRRTKDFYKKVYPDFERMTDGVLGTIKYFSIIGKDGEVLINVLQKQADNPVQTAIPMLRVNSVADFSKKLKSMGGKEVIPQMVCPCTNAYFAILDRRFWKSNADQRAESHCARAIAGLSQGMPVTPIPRPGPRFFFSAHQRTSEQAAFLDCLQMPSSRFWRVAPIPDSFPNHNEAAHGSGSPGQPGPQQAAFACWGGVRSWSVG
jgi:hypothetical protein